MRRSDVVSCSGVWATVPLTGFSPNGQATKQTLWLIISSPKRIEIFKARLRPESDG
jgi:hypothetical protein